jgi:hypothetical protein
VINVFESLVCSLSKMLSKYDSQRMSLQHITTNSQELWDERHLQVVPPGPYATISVPVGHTDRTDHCSVSIHYVIFFGSKHLDQFLSTFHESFSFESPVCQGAILEFLLHLLVHCKSPCVLGFVCSLRQTTSSGQSNK